MSCHRTGIPGMSRMSAAAVQCDPSVQFGVTLKRLIFFKQSFVKMQLLFKISFCCVMPHIKGPSFFSLVYKTIRMY